MITPASFVIDFPEFVDAGIYPPASVNFWLNMATLMLNPCRWGSSPAGVINPPTALIDIATELFVAHNLALEAQAQNAATVGGVPGMTTGPVAAKSINGVSVSYDVGAGIDANDGQYNLTVYGTRFAALSRLFGAGGVQL